MSNTTYAACEECFRYLLLLDGKCLDCYNKGHEAVNTVNRSAAVRQLPALSPLHETFRSGRYFKRTWTSK